MKTYNELNEEIRETRTMIDELLDRRATVGDPYNDISASIDELEETLDMLIDERNAMVGC